MAAGPWRESNGAPSLSRGRIRPVWRAMPWFVYILECAGGRPYVGMTANVDARFGHHLAGDVAAFTRKHPPVRVIFREPHETEAAAVRRERRSNAGRRQRNLRSRKAGWMICACWPDCTRSGQAPPKRAAVPHPGHTASAEIDHERLAAPCAIFCVRAAVRSFTHQAFIFA